MLFRLDRLWKQPCVKAIRESFCIWMQAQPTSRGTLSLVPFAKNRSWPWSTAACCNAFPRISWIISEAWEVRVLRCTWRGMCGNATVILGAFFQRHLLPTASILSHWSIDIITTINVSISNVGPPLRIWIKPPTILWKLWGPCATRQVAPFCVFFSPARAPPVAILVSGC